MNGWAVIAACITVSGSLIALVINLIISDRQKRRAKILETLLARCDEQISKFYAPLANLVEQLDATDDLKKQMVESDKPHEAQINAITYRKYFLAIHRKIAEIFENNLHLIEGLNLPPSFIKYHKHVASEKVYFSLVENIEEAKSKGQISNDADSTKITCSPIAYPEPDFKNDIYEGLHAVLRRQEEIIKMLDKELVGLITNSNRRIATRLLYNTQMAASTNYTGQESPKIFS